MTSLLTALRWFTWRFLVRERSVATAASSFGVTRNGICISLTTRVSLAPSPASHDDASTFDVPLPVLTVLVAYDDAVLVVDTVLALREVALLVLVTVLLLCDVTVLVLSEVTLVVLGTILALCTLCVFRSLPVLREVALVVLCWTAACGIACLARSNDDRVGFGSNAILLL